MAEEQKIIKKFNNLCREISILDERSDGIGIYNEKRLHRILKRLVCDYAECHEIKIGTKVADVLYDETIYEIQTGSFRPLSDKIKYYLENTDYKVVIIAPIIAEKKLVRIDADTGEILRKRRSPKRSGYIDLLQEFYYLKDIFPDPRLTVRVMLISAEEYRYSEKIRYRKKGAYVSELFPTKLCEYRDILSLSDVADIIPDTDEEFSLKDFESLSGLKGRKASFTLNTCVTFGLIGRRKEGKKYIYYKINK